MMAQKAKLFGNDYLFNQILESKEQSVVKKLGRSKKINFDEKIWNENKESIVLKGNILKFMENKSLGDYLISTNPSYLVEASPYDKVWGIGLDKKSPLIKYPQQ